MQSNGNSFWGYVVLANFNKASRDDDDNILDQMYKKQINSDLYYNLEFLKFIQNVTNVKLALKPNFMSSLL